MRHDLTKCEMAQRFKDKTTCCHSEIKHITYPLLKQMSYKELSNLFLKVKVLSNGDLDFER
jgi:hypothetical protein